jgi:hypothetical protein
MDRRTLLAMIAAATAAPFYPREASWAVGPDASLPFSGAEVDFLDDVAETILPRTDTPGARDAAVGDFIARYTFACHPPEQVVLLKAGIADIEARMRRQQGTGFRQATGAARASLLTDIDREAKEHARAGGAPHYFTLMKQLTLFGFFTSEAGATRVARYRPVPGPYQGCIPYVDGETFWAW